MRGAYASAGVDIDAAARAKELIKKLASSTSRPGVLSEVGLFAGLFQPVGYKEPVLVASVDGVGTKLKIASLFGKYDTVGIDLVNHCVNDIFTCGAVPLFFLDYIAMGKLVPEQVESLAKGLTSACREVGCALLGGETAEMPGLYAEGDFDLVGFIIGGVEKKGIMDGRSIEAGDVLLGLPSSGLHTNGYSLVRRIFKLEANPAPLHQSYPELGRTLGEELLEPHRCYYPVLKGVLPLLKGMAHITGGGIVDNLPRIIPRGLACRVEVNWTIPPIFSMIQRRGKVSRKEMFRVFNMGIGMVLVCSPAKVGELRAALPEAEPLGKVVKQEGGERVILVFGG